MDFESDNGETSEMEADVDKRRTRRRYVEPDMDIAPMIDLTFLLLIFFLVSSRPDQLTAIDLPEATHGVGVSEVNSVILTVGMGGLGNAPVYAADGRIPGTELADDPETQRQQIRELVEQGLMENRPNVIIKADKNVAHREVARVVKAVSQVEGVRIHLAVLDKQ